MSFTQEELEKFLGFRVNSFEIYAKAFTHKSRSLEVNQNVSESYENLEFLGDAALELIVVKYVYDTFGNKKREGSLTQMKARIVQGKTLSSIAMKIGIPKYILMDEKGYEKQWNYNPSIMEDVMEALLGAIYLDRGLITARDWFLGLLLNPDIFDMRTIFHNTNYKDVLMRALQARGWALPEYRQVEHNESRQFRVAVFVQGNQLGIGRGSTKKAAEQEGAYWAIRRLEKMENVELLQRKNNHQLKIAGTSN